MASTIRLVTYNVHKCRGWDRRVAPERIACVLAPLDADRIALQEVVDGSPVGRVNQAQAIADALQGKYNVFGRTRELRGSNYGNATLTRLSVECAKPTTLAGNGGSHGAACVKGLRPEAGRRFQVFNYCLRSYACAQDTSVRSSV